MSKQAGASAHVVTWRQFVKFTYPEILSRTYCVPPLHFNRVPYDRISVPRIPTALSALVQQKPPKSPPGSSGQSAQQASQTAGHQQTAASSAPTSTQIQSSVTTCHPTSTSNSPNTQSSQSTSTSPSTTISDQAQSACSTPLTEGCSNSPTVHSTCQSATPGSAQSPPSVSPPAHPPLPDYSLWPIEAHTTDKPSTVFHSDTLDDFSQQYLLYNLHALAKHLGEVMFILSSVNFKNYLTGAPTGQHFPLPRHIKKGIQGDFDFLIIHRHHGLLVGEMKSVGSQRAELQLSEEEDDKCVVKRVDKAVKQLEKGRKVVSHLVGDIVKGLPVRTSLFLPFVSQEQLKRVLTAKPKLAKEVCSCLGVSTLQEAVDMSLCSDELSDPNVYWDVTSHVLKRLTSWWKRRMTSCPGLLLSDDQYIDMVGRFVGPATTVSVHCNSHPRIKVEVRTEGEALAELGTRLARLVLTPEQVDLLNRAPPRVFLAGPPGTGKTVMLVLMAVVWLYRGWNVQVLSIDESSAAACWLVWHQIRKTLESGSDSAVLATTGQVLFRSFRFYHSIYHEEISEEKAIEELIAAAPGQPVCVIMDEAAPNPRIERLVERLLQADPNLHFWMAHIQHNMTCAELQTEWMTRPLRSAPCIVRHVQLALKSSKHEYRVAPYSTDGIPSPADGCSPTVIHHHGADHPGSDPISCYHCGEQLAATLHRLAVGNTGRLVPNSPESLHFRDVLLVTWGSGYPAHDDLTDPEGTVILPASDLIRALRDKGIPVRVLERIPTIEDLTEKCRWEKHRLHGCRLQGENTGKKDEVLWDDMTLQAKDRWKDHFQEGCEVESKEMDGRWKAHRQTWVEEWKTQMEDVVTARHDEVTMTSYDLVQGLEKKVVVSLMAESSSCQGLYYGAKLLCISRCTTHLIFVYNGDPANDPEKIM